MERIFSVWWESLLQSKGTKRIRLRGKSTQNYKGFQWMEKKSILKAPFEREELFCTQKATDNSSKHIYHFLHPKPTTEDWGQKIRRVCSTFKSVCARGTLLQTSSSKPASWMILKIICLPFHPLVFSFCFFFFHMLCISTSVKDWE